MASNRKRARSDLEGTDNINNNSSQRRRLNTNNNSNSNNNGNNDKNNNKTKSKKKKEIKRLQVKKEAVIKGLKDGTLILKKKSEFNIRKTDVDHWESFRHVVYADGLHAGDAVYGPRNGYWVFCDKCKDYYGGLLDLNSSSTTNTMKTHVKKCGNNNNENKNKNNNKGGNINKYFISATDTNATDSD
eukprot:389606_1